jgi:hypothetical protein
MLNADVTVLTRRSARIIPKTIFPNFISSSIPYLSVLILFALWFNLNFSTRVFSTYGLEASGQPVDASAEGNGNLGKILPNLSSVVF